MTRLLKKQLILLGVWNVPPLGFWKWFNDVSIKKFQSLTGRKLGIFCYVKNDLSYQCFLENDTDLLKRDLEALSLVKQSDYINRITYDYYKEVIFLEKQLELSEFGQVAHLSDEKLANVITALADVW